MIHRTVRGLKTRPSSWLSLMGWVVFGVLLVGCDPSDPPPADADVQTAVADWSDGIAAAKTGPAVTGGAASTWTNAGATASYALTVNAGGATSWTLTLKAYPASKNTVTGTMACTSSGGVSSYAGSFTMTGGTVRSLAYQDVSSSAGSYAGTLLVNGTYRYSADTFQRQK